MGIGPAVNAVSPRCRGRYVVQRCGIAQAADVAIASSQSNPVEVFSNGDSVLPRCTKEIAELGHGHRRAVGQSFPDLSAKLGIGFGVDVQL
jgi:hypothetical protein